MALSRTVLPWALEWLIHYEIWLAIGVWTGGGHEHDAPARPGPPDVRTPAPAEKSDGDLS